MKKTTIVVMMMIAAGLWGETTKPAAPPDRTVSEVEQLRLDKATAEMIAVQAQFQLLKSQEEQLQAQFGQKQGEFVQIQNGIYERLKIKKEDFSLQQKQQGDKKIWVLVEVEKQRPAASAQEIEKTKQQEKK